MWIKTHPHIQHTSLDRGEPVVALLLLWEADFKQPYPSSSTEFAGRLGVFSSALSVAVEADPARPSWLRHERTHMVFIRVSLLSFAPDGQFPSLTLRVHPSFLHGRSMWYNSSASESLFPVLCRKQSQVNSCHLLPSAQNVTVAAQAVSAHVLHAAHPR